MAKQSDLGNDGGGGKSGEAFRTISEVASDLDVAQHVLRFWETKFPQISPLKRGGGRRYYRPEDIALLTRIRALLYDEGYTIKGAQKLLREQGRRGGSTPREAPASGAPQSGAQSRGAQPRSGDLSARTRKELQAIAGDLRDLRTLIDRAIG